MTTSPGRASAHPASTISAVQTSTVRNLTTAPSTRSSPYADAMGCQYLLRRPLLDDGAAIHEHHGVGNLPGKSDLVRHYHQGGAVARELRDDVQYLGDQFGVERRGGLVKQNNLGTQR